MCFLQNSWRNIARHPFAAMLETRRRRLARLSGTKRSTRLNTKAKRGAAWLETRCGRIWCARSYRTRSRPLHRLLEPPAVRQ